jgi:hypothetical protein
MATIFEGGETCQPQFGKVTTRDHLKEQTLFLNGSVISEESLR